MGIRVHIHPLLVDITSGRELVEVEGLTVGECLRSLTARFPGLAEHLFDERGGLRPEIECYLHGEGAAAKELDHPLREGDDLSILMHLAGG